MYGIVLAGGQPDEEDPLFPYVGDKPKALLAMGDRTMLERVVDALQDCRYVEHVVVAGLGDDMGMQFMRPVHHLADQGSMLANILWAAEWVRDQAGEIAHVLVSSADIPAINGAIVDAFVDACRPFDAALYYNFVTRETMEARFPHSSRTFVKLKGMQIAGGDLALMDPDVLLDNTELVTSLVNARKHAWKLARQVGLYNLLKFLTRQMTVADIEDIAGRIAGRKGRVILSPFAELAMDADKPHQIDVLRRDLAGAPSPPGRGLG